MSSDQTNTPGAPLSVPLQQFPQQTPQQPYYVQQMPGNQIQLYPQVISQPNTQQQQQFVYAAMPMTQSPTSTGQPLVFIQPQPVPVAEAVEPLVGAQMSRWGQFKSFLNTPTEYSWPELVLAGFLGFESLAALITGFAFFVYFGAFVCALAVFWFGLVKQSLSWLYFGIYMQFGWWLFSWPVIIFTDFWELNVLTSMCVVFTAGCYQWAYVHHQKKRLASIMQAAQEEEQVAKPELSSASASVSSSTPNTNTNASEAAQQLQSIQNWQSIIESTVTRTLSMGSSFGGYSLAAVFVVFFACAQLVAPVGYYWLTVYSFIGYPVVGIVCAAVLFRCNWVIALGVLFEVAVIIFTFVMFVSFYMNFMIYMMFTSLFAYQFGGLLAGLWLIHRNRKSAAVIAL